MDRAEVADTPRRQRLLAARVGAYQPPRFVVPGVGHLVGALAEVDARLGAGPGGFDDRVPDLARLEGAAGGAPGGEVTGPGGVEVWVGGVREDKLPVAISLNRLHERVRDSDGDV